MFLGYFSIFNLPEKVIDIILCEFERKIRKNIAYMQTNQQIEYSQQDQTNTAI